MIEVNPYKSILLLVEEVALMLRLPEDCFYLTLLSSVLRGSTALTDAGFGAGSHSCVCEGARWDATRQLRYWRRRFWAMDLHEPAVQG